MSCAVVVNSFGTYNITFANAVPTAGIAASTTFAFVINTGFTTPLTTETSGSFFFYSRDASGYLIDKTTESLTITMTVGNVITDLAASSNLNTVSSTFATHSLTFTTPISIQAGY